MRRAVPWGGRGSGGPAPPPTLSYPPSGPSPAPPLVWGLGLWRWRVVPAVAPVGEGAAQSPGEPVVGVRIRDAEQRSPFQEGRPRRLPVGPRRPDHRPEEPLMVLWGCPPPRGYLSVSSVSPEEHGIEGPVPRPPGGPLVGPAQPPVHLPHQGEGLLPQRVRDRAPVPVPWPAPLCPPCQPPSLPLRLRRRCRAPPPSAEAICAGSALGARGAGWCRGRGGWGGASSLASGSML